MRDALAPTLALAALALCAGASSAAAAPAPLGLGDCGPAAGAYQCAGLVRTWDGVPLDTTVTLPSAAGADRPRALVVEVHGFGNSKYEYLDPEDGAYTGNSYSWARDGYAVLTFTARGLWGSCGAPEARVANPVACASGYIHLADVRYEVRDIQELVGRLVDERIADPSRIGVTGDSYGGGQSLMLAALRDRVMLPDGSLAAWRSPAGTPLRLAAAAPVIPWTDLVYAAAPNGRVFADAITPRSLATTPVGVEKASVVNAIFAAAQFAVGPGQPPDQPFVPGRPMGFLAPAGLDPDADVAGWVARTDAGEPYDDESATRIVDQLARYHSPYYVPATRRPAPMLLASGFTDDLFPVDEVLRYANRTRARWPHLPLALLLGDFGHQRAANKPQERSRLRRSIHAWFDHELLGRGRRPGNGVVAFAQTCPRSVPSRGPFRAKSFAKLARGEVRLRSTKPQRLTSADLDPATGAALDPAAGGGDGCVAVPARPAPETPTYSLGVHGARGFTLLGAPTVAARISVSGARPVDAEIAARLWDVSADGATRRLVARGLYRPQPGARQLFQLHPGAWRFEPGHTLELELLGGDAPYARPSNSRFAIDVRRLRLRLPVRQRPGAAQVRRASPPPLLPGQRRAP